MKWQHLACLLPLVTAMACVDEAGPTGSEPEISAVDQPAAIITLPQKRWVGHKPMPTPRKNLAVAAVDGIVYAIGGDGGLATVEAYDPVVKTWSTRIGLLEGRTMATATAIGGKIHVTGGRDGLGKVHRALSVFNPAANSWAHKADLPVESIGGASAAIGGKLYVYTPRNPSTEDWPMLHRYDPATNAWVKLARPPRSVTLPAAGVIEGKLYLAGGRGYSSTSNQLDVYDPATNSWATKASMPTARYDAAGAVGGGSLLSPRLYVIGGITTPTGPKLATVEAYNPVTNSWTTEARLRVPRRGLGATAAKGIIHALGGANDTEPLATHEAY
jgi:N-acetylneuraminic acid mutarotase